LIKLSNGLKKQSINVESSIVLVYEIASKDTEGPEEGGGR